MNTHTKRRVGVGVSCGTDRPERVMGVTKVVTPAVFPLGATHSLPTSLGRADRIRRALTFPDGAHASAHASTTAVVALLDRATDRLCNSFVAPRFARRDPRSLRSRGVAQPYKPYIANLDGLSWMGWVGVHVFFGGFLVW